MQAGTNHPRAARPHQGTGAHGRGGGRRLRAQRAAPASSSAILAGGCDGRRAERSSPQRSLRIVVSDRYRTLRGFWPCRDLPGWRTGCEAPHSPTIRPGAWATVVSDGSALSAIAASRTPVLSLVCSGDHSVSLPCARDRGAGTARGRTGPDHQLLGHCGRGGPEYRY